jgi:hypothetical protein
MSLDLQVVLDMQLIDEYELIHMSDGEVQQIIDECQRLERAALRERDLRKNAMVGYE